MRLLHGLAKIRATFDDPNLVSRAGLVPVMALAQRAGLGGLVAGHVRIARPCGVNAHLKVPCLEDLDYGYVDGITAAVRTYPLEGVKKDEAEKELGYFLNNAPRMRYHWFRSRGLFVGSGVVEASCKTIVGQRLQAGRHALDRRRSRRHHHPALQRGQQPAGSHLQPPSQPDRSRLICLCPKMITLEQGPSFQRR